MSSEAPYFLQDYNRSLVQNGWGEVGGMIPLVMKQMGGLPVHLPGTLSDSGYGNYYDDYLEMLLLEGTGNSYNEARNVDAQAQERTLTILAQRAAATAGIKLGPRQIAVIRQIANLIGTYGPMILSAAKSALAASAAEDGNKPDAITIMVNAFESLLNSTYGPVGSRMAFYGTAKQALHRLAENGQQDAIISEVMHKLFPEGADTQFTGGLDTSKTASVVQHMLNRGQNPLNTNTAAMKSLIREQSEKGWEGLSGAEQARVTSKMADVRMNELFKAGNRTQNIIQWAESQSGKAGGGKMTYEAAANYAAQLEGVSSLERDLQATGFLEKGTSLATASLDTLGKLDVAIEARKGDYDESTEEGQKALQQLEALQKRFNPFKQARENYEKAGGNANENITQQINELAKNNLIEAYKKAGYDEKQSAELAELYQKHEKLASMGITTRLLDSTSEEDAAARADYIKHLEDNKDKIAEEAFNIYKELYTPDKEGKTKAGILAENRAVIHENYSKDAEKEAQQIIDQYSKLLLTGTDKEIKAFRNDNKNKPILDQLEAIIVGNKAKADIGVYSRAAARFFNAIQATGPAVTSDRRMVSDIRGAAKMMSEITQMGGEKQLSSEDWEEYWSRIAYTMGSTKTNANVVGQMASTAAKIAEATGGDRVTASMAAAELGLYMKENALLNNASPDSVTAIAGSLVGRASNSMFTHKVNALATEITKNTDLTKLNDTEREIVKKIQEGKLLTKEEMVYVDNNVNSMLEKIGVSSGGIISALQRTVSGKKGQYAMQVGGYYSTDDQNIRSIKEHIAQRGFAQKGLDFGDKNSLVQKMLYDIYTTDDEARSDDSGETLKKRLKIQFPELAPEIDKIDANALYNIAKDINSESARAKGISVEENIEQEKAVKNLEETQAKNTGLGDILSLMPFKVNDRIQAVMQTLMNPESDVKDLANAGITRDIFTPEKIDNISTIATLAGIYLKDKNVLKNSKGETISDEKIDTANEVFRKIASDYFGGDIKSATEALVTKKEIEAKITKAGLDINKLLNNDTAELEKAKGVLTPKELGNLRKYKQIKGIDNFDVFYEVFDIANTRAKTTINANSKKLKPASNSAFTADGLPSISTPSDTASVPEGSSTPDNTSSATDSDISIPAVTTDNQTTNTPSSGSTVATTSGDSSGKEEQSTWSGTSFLSMFTQPLGSEGNPAYVVIKEQNKQSVTGQG